MKSSTRARIVFSLGVVLHELLGGGARVPQRSGVGATKGDRERAAGPAAGRSAPAADCFAGFGAGSGAPLLERRGDAEGDPGNPRRTYRPRTSGFVGAGAAARGSARAAYWRVCRSYPAAGGDRDDIASVRGQAAADSACPAAPGHRPRRGRQWARCLSPIPVHNTLAGIGPDDQALVPIELVELPGLPTEKAMPTVPADDADTNRVTRADQTGTVAAAPPPPPSPAGLANGSEPAASKLNQPEQPPSPSPAAGATTGPPNGESPTESSWTPPALEPLAPSPEPLFAAPAVERPEPVEPARSTVPGVKLPPTKGTGASTVLGGVVLLAAVGALAIYAGLSGNERPMAGSTGSTGNSQVTMPGTVLDTSRAENRARATAAATDLAHAVALNLVPTPATATKPTAAGEPSPNPTAAEAPAPHATAAEAPAPHPTAAGAPAPHPAAAGAPPPHPAVAGAPAPHPAVAGAPPPHPAVAGAPAPHPAATGTPTASPPSALAGPTFAVTSTPDGAALFVDGENKGTTPAQIAVAPGRHKLIVLGEGQKMVKREVDFVAGRTIWTLPWRRPGCPRRSPDPQGSRCAASRTARSASSSTVPTAVAPAPTTSASASRPARTRSACTPRAPARCTSSSARSRKATTRRAYTSDTEPRRSNAHCAGGDWGGVRARRRRACAVRATEAARDAETEGHPHAAQDHRLGRARHPGHGANDRQHEEGHAPGAREVLGATS